MPHGHPTTGREEYVLIKLHKDTHRLWAERKRALQLKSDNELGLYLLSRPSALPTAIRDISQELETVPVTQATQLLMNENKVREDSQSTESLCEARPDVSFVYGRLSTGNGSKDGTSNTLTR